MSLQSWLNTNLNQVHLNPDPPNGIDGQCVNASSSWSMAQGGPQLFGIGDSSTAWTVFQTFRHPFYDVVSGTPHSGDIAFFQPNLYLPDIETGYAGHTSVVVDQISGGGFRSVDSDWGGDPSLIYVNHSYNGVAGYFRPKGASVQKVTLDVARILAYGVLGRNGVTNPVNALSGACDDDLNKYHVGNDFSLDYVRTLYNSSEAQNFRGALGNALLNAGDVQNLYKALLGRDAEPEAIKGRSGQPWHDQFYQITDSPERQAYVKKIADLQANAQYTPVTETLYRKK